MVDIDLPSSNNAEGSGRPSRVRKRDLGDFSMDASGDSNSEGKRKKKKSIPSKSPSDGKKVEIKLNPTPAFPAHALPFMNPVKRPRGRPPLVAKRPQSISIASTTPSSLQQQLLQPPSIPLAVPMPSQLASVTSGAPSTSSKSIEPPDNQLVNTKAPRPPYQKVVNQLISTLMVNEPLTLHELSKRMDDCPKDMIQSAIDILQVFSVVIQVKAKQGFRPECQAGTVLYCLTQFAKGPVAVPIGEIAADTAMRLATAVKVQKRIEELRVSSARFAIFLSILESDPILAFFDISVFGSRGHEQK